MTRPGPFPSPVEGAPPPMTPERWRAVDAVLQAALACPPAQRAAFVADACGSDAALRREVESLLAATPEGDFLEQPAMAAHGSMVRAGSPAARLALAVGDRYVVERELARGGMATVHLAHDPRLGRRVAIKVLREELSAAVGAERFMKEIEVTAALQHPHILPLFESGRAGGMLYYVMPYIEGDTLRDRLKRDGRLPLDEALRLAREMADALDYAHRRGVVHRDVKPENVLLKDDHALVADFGIALALEQAGGERLTRTGLALGTPQYMAPEQAGGERGVDARADVYALGAVAYEMIAGEPPFAGPTLQAVMSRALREPPPPLATRRSGVPPHVDAAVRRALAKRPADRFPTAAAFAAALSAPAEEAWEARPAAPATRGRWLSAGAVAKIAVAALGVGMALGVPVGRWTATLTGDAPSLVPPAVDAILPGGGAGGLTLAVVDRAGRQQRAIPAERPWTPRFSPDGRRILYGAFAAGRGTSDVWVTDVATGETRQLTDGEGDANDPQWSPDGKRVAFSVSADGGKDVHVQGVDGGASSLLAPRPGNQFPSDWLRDGSAVLLTDEGGGNQDIVAQPADGSPARPWAATEANESAARVSPDGRWVAYTSDATGRAEVWVQSYPKADVRLRVSTDGGVHPAWRGDGRELYYWRDGELVAAGIGTRASGALEVTSRTSLFRAPYQGGIHASYDVSPDGQRFVIVLQR